MQCEGESRSESIIWYDEMQCVHRAWICVLRTVCLSVSAACRAGKIEEAVVFAQTSLAPLRGLMTSRMGVSDAMLREVIALLAYENPMVRVRLCMRADEPGTSWLHAGMSYYGKGQHHMLHENLVLPVMDTDMAMS